jgi:glycosyltransferase involved in cell wall biosynthesis
MTALGPRSVGALNQAVAAASRPRVLVMAHSHPRITRGGAEIAAYTLYQGLRDFANAKTWFLGCAPDPAGARLGANLTQPYGADEFVYTLGAPFDYFKVANRDPEFPRILGELVAELRPDIVHTHHYTHFGVEAFAVIRRACPQVKIVVSLHEFLAICHNHGQMVKTRTARLCKQESPTDCAACFPEMAPRDFFLRKRYIQTFLEDVDLFISPSRFLAERYIAWGLPALKMRVLENMPPVADHPDPGPAPNNGLLFSRRQKAQARTGDALVRIGFFGQMSPLKGITVLIEAAKQLSDWNIDNLVIDIHGDYSNKPLEFQKVVETSLREAGKNVTYCGPYSNADVHRLMQSVNAVLVPSIWWENSPVVIQEAYANGKPVICSDIGGMAEKVRPGLDGLHFEAGRPASLARVLRDVALDPTLLPNLSKTLARPKATPAAVDAHLALYRELLVAPA